MASKQGTQLPVKVGIVVGTLPNVEEIDQFRELCVDQDIVVISTESICNFLNETSRFKNLQCYALPDHDENPSYIPGLESVLKGFDVVILKERLGLYAYQVVKAKWRHKFRLVVWSDNLAVLPAEDIDQMRTIRNETTNAADAFFVQSKAAAATLRIEGVEDQRIFHVHAHAEKVVDRNPKMRAKAIEALGLAESHYIIGAVCPIEWEEGILDLASLLAILNEKKKSNKDKIRVVLSGIGSFAPQIKQILIRLGVDNQIIFVAPGRDAYAMIYAASDVMYFNSIPSRDRIDGDPSRIITAMTNGIPILASRNSVVEEYCGKHRIDFCSDSVEGLAAAVEKAISTKSIVNNIVSKNLAEVERRFSVEKSVEKYKKMITEILEVEMNIDNTSIDHQVMNIESLVSSKQYLKAIDIIESIFKQDDIPIHHKANLYRLVGDCFAKLSDNEGAKNAYIKAIELDAYSGKAYIGLGTVSLVKQNHDIAVLHFQKAVSLAPQDEMANLGLGLSFQGLDELKEAKKWVIKALESNFENTAALYTLVKIAYDLEEYKIANQFVQRYVDAHPFDQNMIFTLAGLKFKLSQYQQVIDLSSEILKVDPLDAKAHGLLKQAQRALDADNSVSKKA